MSAAEDICRRMQGKQVFNDGYPKQEMMVSSYTSSLTTCRSPTRQQASSDTAEASWIMGLREIDLIAGLAML